MNTNQSQVFVGKIEGNEQNYECHSVWSRFNIRYISRKHFDSFFSFLLVSSCTLPNMAEHGTSKLGAEDFVVVDGEAHSSQVQAHRRFLGRLFYQRRKLYGSLRGFLDMVHTCQPSPHPEADPKDYAETLSEFEELNRQESKRYLIVPIKDATTRISLQPPKGARLESSDKLLDEANQNLFFDIRNLIDWDHANLNDTLRSAIRFNVMDIVGSIATAPMRISGDTSPIAKAQREAAKKLQNDMKGRLNQDTCHIAPGIPMPQTHIDEVKRALRASEHEGTAWRRVVGLCALRLRDNRHSKQSEKHSLGGQLLETLVNHKAQGVNIALFSNRSAVSFYRGCYPRCTVEANFKPEGKGVMMRQLFLFPSAVTKTQMLRCSQHLQNDSFCGFPPSSAP